MLDLENLYEELGKLLGSETKESMTRWLKSKEMTNKAHGSDCMHDNCPQCHGTGVRDDGLGACIHMISCPCRRCNPFVC